MPRVTASIVAVCICVVTLLGVGDASAVVIDITLESNPPPTSAQLASYIPTISAGPPGEPRVGFNAADIGEGSGTGVNELFAFSFVFDHLSVIDSASLTLDITAKGTSTDHLLFADNDSVRGFGVTNFKGYGHDLIKDLAFNSRTLVTFDLSSIGITDPFFTPAGSEDLRFLLTDGAFDVVFVDDAIIHSARLVVESTEVVEPSSFLLFIFATLALGTLRSLLKHRDRHDS